LLYHFGSFKNFKHYFLHYICVHLKQKFPNVLSYNRFIQIEHRVFMPVIFFLKTVCFWKCTSITFIDSTKMIKVNYFHFALHPAMLTTETLKQLKP
jgi:hypothetical protein